MIKMSFFTTSEPITDNSIVTDLLDKIAKLNKRVEDLEQKATQSAAWSRTDNQTWGQQQRWRNFF